MIKLDTEINIGDFFHWWGAQLAALLPESIKDFFVHHHEYLLVEPKGGSLVLTKISAAEPKTLNQFSIDTEGKLDFQNFFRKHPDLPDLDLILRLPADQGISKVITLPAAAANNVEQVVLYELDKLTPFKDEQVYFAVKAQDADVSPSYIKPTLIIVPRNKLDGYFHCLKDWGANPVVADYQGVANIIDKRQSQYNLLPEQYRQKKKRGEEFLLNSLSIVIVILILAAIALPVWIENQTVEQLTEQVDSVERDVKIIDGYKTEIDELYKEATALIESKKNQPSGLTMLNTISQLIADDTWLTYIKYNSGKVQIQGQSPNASSLIGALEASPLFDNTHFVSPVTQDKKTGLERFQIAAEVTRGADNE